MQLEQLGEKARGLVKGNKAAVVTDENVEKLYLGRCVESLHNAGFEVYSFTVAPGEQSKSGETYLSLLEFLAEIPLTRADTFGAFRSFRCRLLFLPQWILPSEERLPSTLQRVKTLRGLSISRCSFCGMPLFWIHCLRKSIKTVWRKSSSTAC